MDVDGTLTDGKIYMGTTGEAFKAFNIKDGYGICHILPAIEMEPVIITGRESSIVENRCKELGITMLYQGVHDKAQKIVSLTDNHPELVAFIGDDLNDIAAMKLVVECGGVVGCPKDAAAAVQIVAHFVSSKEGGNGAVREFIEWLADQNMEVAQKNER